MELDLAIEMPSELEKKPETLLTQAQAVEICDNDTFLVANDLDAGLNDMEKEIIEFFRDPKKKAHEAHKAVVAAETKALDPVRRARSLLKPKLGHWLQEQERKRQELQRKLEEDARKREEEERLQQAVALEKEGLKEEAQAIINEPIIAPVVTAPKLTPDVKGLSSRETWKASVFDLRALVKAVATGQVPIQALLANDTFLNQQARALKSDLNYPGVRVVRDVGIARRSN